MEILAETVYTGFHYGTIALGVILSLLTSLITVGLVYMAISDRDGGAALASLITVAVAALFVWGTYDVIKTGPVVEYTAKVTDYNEVYEQGYEILRHEGKLVILTKESR